jgi:Holliday junction resolvase
VARSERRKGIAGELEVRDVFRAHGFDCDRTPNSGGLRIRGDLIGTVPVHVEVKRQERLQLWQWLAQAERDAGAAAYVVAFRRSRGGWYGAAPLDVIAAAIAGQLQLGP